MPTKLKCFTKPRIPVANGGQGGNYTVCLSKKKLDKSDKKKLIINKRVKPEKMPVVAPKKKLIITKRVKSEKKTVVAPKKKLIITKRVGARGRLHQY